MNVRFFVPRVKRLRKIARRSRHPPCNPLRLVRFLSSTRARGFNFGQIRTPELRDSANLPKAHFRALYTTRSSPRICGRIAQNREMRKVVSNPVRVALPL
jgi:hypothetical protein